MSEIGTFQNMAISLQDEAWVPFLVRQSLRSLESAYIKSYQGNITQTEMRTAAANIKDVLCKSIDMILAQNIAVLDQASSFDRKLIQTYIDEAEHDALSTLKLIGTFQNMAISLQDEAWVPFLVRQSLRSLESAYIKSYQGNILVCLSSTLIENTCCHSN
jgi:hypothetical protein